MRKSKAFPLNIISESDKTFFIKNRNSVVMLSYFFVFFVLFFHRFGSSATIIPDLLPLPQQYGTPESSDDRYIVLNYQEFEFYQTNKVRKITDTIERYLEIIFFDTSAKEVKTCPSGEKCVSSMLITVQNVNVSVPSFGMNEKYSIELNGEQVTLECQEMFGCYRGIETFAQMMKVDTSSKEYYLDNFFPIVDFPRFSWRGLMIDSSRHFVPVHKIKDTIDKISWLKINTLHWHIVDAQSFPLEVKSYPLLDQKGSYSYPNAIYTQDDLISIRDYAFDRGIRIMIEIDTPGHSHSWGKGYPEILPDCTEDDINSYVLNPIVNETYQIIEAISAELTSIFPDEYFHYGGDEVKYDCWKQDKSIKKYKDDHLWLSYAHFVGLFEENLHEIYTSLGKTMVCWEECVLDDNYWEHYKLPKETTVVQVWKSGTQYKHLHEVISKKGYNALLSGGWYLNDQLQWKDYYQIEPFSDYKYTDEEKERLFGGEACAWGEHLDQLNYDTLIFPNLQAIAERLWSNEDVNDVNEGEIRHEKLRCQFVRRGLMAGPICPSYCVYADT